MNNEISICRADAVPILVVGYNRASYFRRTIDSLIENPESRRSHLYVSIDGPRNVDDEKEGDQMRSYVEDIKDCFKTVEIWSRDKNLGLRKNMIESISQIFQLHDRAIILEDDIVVSKSYLAYMNDALLIFEKSLSVWHVCGHSVVNNKHRLNDFYFYRVMSCWGWGTWRDRWINFIDEKRPEIFELNGPQVKKFNLDGKEDFWSQVLLNRFGYIDTWAIFWYLTIFEKNGLCVNPCNSLCKNIGCDDSGTHGGGVYNTLEGMNLNEQRIVFSVDRKFEEDAEMLELIKSWYDERRRTNVVRRLLRFFTGILVPYKLRIKLRWFFG